MKTIKTLKLKTHYRKILLVCAASAVLSACGGSGNSTHKRYQVTVYNLTSNQPLSPLAIVAHKPGLHLFQAGQTASIALEHLAEGGSNQQLLDEVRTRNDYIADQAGSGVLPPGNSETLELKLGDVSDFSISVVSMLVNTNDAFAAFETNKVTALATGERISFNVPAWDAGTEPNSETAGSIPGPADGGEGFNASRAGDSDFVSIHPGIISQSDGLATSVLDESHRFDNPVAKIMVERVE